VRFIQWAESRILEMGKKIDLGAMSTDEMWQLHTEIGRLLSVRLTSEKRELEKRLARLRRDNEMPQVEAVPVERSPSRERRRYPRVLPKYQNPDEPSETWSGRGKQPRWLTLALKTGHTIEEFVIGNVGSGKDKARQHAKEV
jgi:DNA-binding protein H-NS